MNYSIKPRVFKIKSEFLVTEMPWVALHVAGTRMFATHREAVDYALSPAGMHGG